MDNKFENVEDIMILSLSIIGIIYLSTLSSSIMVKLGLGFLTFIAGVTTFTVTRSVVRYIKDCKKNKRKKQKLELNNEEKKFEINLEKKLESEIKKELDNYEKINFEGENANEIFSNYHKFKEKDEPKQLILKK